MRLHAFRGSLVVVLALVAIGAALGPRAAHASEPPIRDRIHSHPNVEFAACGKPGQACCRHASMAEGLDPRYCKAGAGCDVATDKCVAPCGGSGQVCCDGPDTFAPQADRTPTGALYCVNGNCVARKQMCAAGACTRDTRRCDTSCGKTAGGACCPPDAGIAVASCKVDGLLCRFGAADMKSGTCIECGAQGQPPCPGDECRASGGVRTMARNDVCIACGYVNGPVCNSGKKCDGPYVARGGVCIPAGGQDQQCLDGRLCGYDGMYCDAGNVCRLCGAPGQPCCPTQPQSDGSVLKECGGYSNLQCASFNGRRVCQYKPGQAPGSGSPPAPPANAPKTCGGNAYQLGVTTTYPAWARQSTGCAVIAGTFTANSPQEALQCARSAYGSAVIDGAVQEYQYSMDGPLGCRTVYVYGASEDDAQECAQAQCTNCSAPSPGACP